MAELMSIDELAESAGLTRRAVRFYVQQKLLPVPLGVGRGKHYDETHRDRLKRIQELQTAGYSLDAIRRLLAGETVPQPTTPTRRRARPVVAAELWTKLKLAEGCELHLDVSRFDLDPTQLAAARDLLREVLGLAEEKETGDERQESDDRSQETDRE